MLDPWRLHLLRQLHQLGTVRAVADALHMSPSSVSQQLTTLEKEAGAHLLERAGRRVRLTPVGLALARHATEILDHIESVEAEIAGLHSEPTGTVRVAAFTSVLHTVLIPAVRRLHATHPRISVVVTEAEPSEALPALHRGEVDLAVSGDFQDSPEPSDPDLVRRPLTRDDVVLVLAEDATPPGVPAPGDPHEHEAVHLAALSDATWAFEKPGAHLADLAERLCLRAGFRPRVAARCMSHGSLLRYVEAGLAVTLLPRLAVDGRYAVRILPFADPLERDIHLVGRRAAMSRVAVREVADAITRVAL
ncbi:LysR family transcriptional regulator [Myceligenerans pegani]|uniref:LysR family transcriptional regulator n=1 Tax=Myceligenerans pegani TaxID=2776917 RepID=A0ABR9MX89_9MICO|nr:LysR substrate-binding domain-containing protein [Myceligenerans sp. TRM 65318]MBE1875616.1 LysR family transcriptional regulator [Myceligenerans sp. TRM 65318]MBE3017887.1 LysR family transcriptional regulator [Myceligenerans sp. TRM 65318]